MAHFYQLAEEKLHKSGLIAPSLEQKSQVTEKRDPNMDTLGRKQLEQREFVWDRSLMLLIAGTLSLTSIYAVIELFRRPSSAVICRVPDNVTASQFAYVNSFCSNALPSAQYYPIFLTLQGLFISAPHQLWVWMYGGYTKYFVDLALSLDRLQSVRSGTRREANVAVVTKLEKEFSSRRIFPAYVAKLFLQLGLVAVSLVLSLAAFNDFDVVFKCSKNVSTVYSRSNSQQLDTQPVVFGCLYTPFQYLSVLRYLDIVLLCVMAAVLLFGIGWCFVGHRDQLGAQRLARFTFHLCLPASQVKFLFDGLLSPRIEGDLDFLLMQLHHANKGYGEVFKEIQIDKEFQYVSAKDHKLLHAFSNRRRDLGDYEIGKCPNLDVSHTMRECEYLFQQAGFDGKPFFENCTLQPASSALKPCKGTLRNHLLNFVQFAPSNGLAVEVSFGTAGFGRSLAWIFKEAMTIYFHGLCNKQYPQKETFYTNHFSVNLPQDNFSLNINKASVCIEKELHGRTNDVCFVLVGPIDDQSKVTTVHVLINMLLRSKCLNIIKGAILLTVRPLRIGCAETAHQYFKYQPSKLKFDRLTSGRSKHFVVSTTETEAECEFEFCAYEFISRT